MPQPAAKYRAARATGRESVAWKTACAPRKPRSPTYRLGFEWSPDVALHGREEPARHGSDGGYAPARHRPIDVKYANELVAAGEAIIDRVATDLDSTRPPEGARVARTFGANAGFASQVT